MTYQLHTWLSRFFRNMAQDGENGKTGKNAGGRVAEDDDQGVPEKI